MRTTLCRVLVLVGLALVLVLGGASTALAAPPTISGLTPADGARFTAGFTVSFSAADPAGLNGSAATVTVGSRTYTPSVWYAGYWEGDGCDSWYVEDRTSGSFTCSVPDPGPGVFTVTVRVPNAAGEAVVRTFTITRTAALAFSNHSPAAGSRLLSAERIAVTVTGAVISPASAVMTLDGSAVPASCQIVAPGVAIVSTERTLQLGAHAVTVAVGDGTSAPPATASWAFTISPIAVPPAVGAQRPVDGAIVQGPFSLTYHATDANGVTGASVTVDGRVIKGSFAYAGFWTGDGCDTWWQEDRTQADITFAIPDLAPGPHSLVIEVGDAAGDWTVRRTTLLRSATIQATAQAPANGSRNPAVSLMSVLLTGSAVDPASVSIVVDGVAATPAVTGGADGTLVTCTGVLPQGAHSVRVSASDAVGSPPMSTEWAFVVDATPPDVVSISPEADATMTAADAGMAVRLQDADSVDLTSIVVALDGGVIPHTQTTDASGVWVRWSGVMAEGPHTATILARDIAGNEVSRSWSFGVADPPRFGNLSPFGALAPENALLTAEITDVNDALDPAVTVVLDGTQIPATLVSTGAGRGRIEAPASGLANGTHNVSMTVRDAAGNAASRSWAFAVDALSPTITTRGPALGATLGNHAVTLSATFKDASAISPASLAAWIDGAPVSVQAWNDSRWEGSGCDAYEVIVPETLFVSGTFSLHDGGHTARLQATDAFGHQTVEEWSFVVREYPAVTSVKPTAGTHTKEASATISATMSDFDGIASTAASWRSAGGTWQSLPSTYDPATKALSAKLVFPNGDQGYEVKVDATDLGGLTTSATTSLYVDASGPVFDGAAQTPKSAAVLAARNASFRARFTDSSTIDPASARAWIDGQPVALSAAHETQWVGSGCDAYEEELLGTLVVSGVKELHDGAHTLKISAADVFGFQCTREWTFTVKEQPKITSVAPATSGRTTAAAITVSALVTDYDGVAATAIEWREANTGRPVGEWQTASASYNASSGLLSAGFTFPRDDTRYEFRITGTDSGGLTTTSTTNVFASSSAAQIEAGVDCSACHSGMLQTHPMANCTACHGEPQGPCSCHGTGAHPASWLGGLYFEDHGGGYTGRTCTDCHTHAADVEAQRHASGLDPTCADCHEQALTAEHQGLTADGSTFGCETCHDSADATVTAAIAGSRTDCMACHELASGHNELHRSLGLNGVVDLFGGGHGSSGGAMAVSCGLCHLVEDVSAIHGNQCDTCHPTPRDSFTSWTGGCQQGACHPTIHATMVPGHDAAEAADNCSCHEDLSWDVTEDRCGSCHQLADRIAPVTTTDAKSTYLGAATIVLSATDAPDPGGSGVASTHYRIDGGATQAGMSVVLTDSAGAPKTHTIEYWSVDTAGNTEAAKSLTFTFIVDTTAPVTTSDGKTSYIGPATIHLSATDDSGALPTTYYSLDGGPGVQGTTVSVSQPSSGSESHTLSFWSVDAAGNPETPKALAFTVSADTTPPVTTTNARAFYRYGSSDTISFSATDAGSGVTATYVSLDGGSASQRTTVSTAGLAAGSHTLQFWSVDAVGNTEMARSATFVLDATPPVTSSDARGAYSGTAVITLSPSDTGGSGVATTYYRLDAAPTPSQGTRVSVSSGGYHTLSFWSVDAVGNTEAAKTVGFTVTITDTTAPTTTSDVKASYVGLPTIHLTAADNEGGTGVKTTYYRLNGGPILQGTVIQSDARVSQTLEFWSVDNANNQEAHKTVSFTVTAPTGFGTVQFAWDAPPDAYSNYYCYISQGSLYASASNVTGWWGVHVPLSPLPYSLKVYYYDPELGDYAWSYGTALIDSQGKVVTWWY